MEKYRMIKANEVIRITDELPLYINENINPINLIVKWRLIKGF